MPTEAVKPKITPAQVLEDMEHFTARELESVLERATLLRLQKRKLVLPVRESELLRVINRGLSPEKGARLQRLQQKLRQETITQREHRQLLGLSDELERLGAERLKALIALAAIRKTSVSKLMNELGLAQAGYA